MLDRAEVHHVRLADACLKCMLQDNLKLTDAGEAPT